MRSGTCAGVELWNELSLLGVLETHAHVAIVGPVGVGKTGPVASSMGPLSGAWRAWTSSMAVR